MGVIFFGSKNDLRWVYKPEETQEAQVDQIKAIAKINKENDGYVGPNRELRLEAKIPMSVEYNWCMMRGIPVHMHAEYMKKHYKELLTEFPVFKAVEKL
jgi:hypothetical protein